MRFLVDRCAGRQLAAALREDGHDVAEVQDRGPDPGDRVILAVALAEARILVTMDKDFGHFVFVEDAPHAGIVRLPDVRARDRIALMRKLLSGRFKNKLDGAVVTVEVGRVRISGPLT